MLKDVVKEYKDKHIRFLLANVKGSVRDTMKNSGSVSPPQRNGPNPSTFHNSMAVYHQGLVNEIGVGSFYLTTHDAVDSALADIEARGLAKTSGIGPGAPGITMPSTEESMMESLRASPPFALPRDGSKNELPGKQKDTPDVLQK